MNNNKKIIYVVAGLLILIIIGFVIKKEALSPTAENLNDQSFVATSTPENIVLKESLSVENTDSKTSSNVSNPIKDEAWNLFQKYLSPNAVDYYLQFLQLVMIHLHSYLFLKTRY